MQKILNKISALIDKLSSKPIVGGLYVTDSAIQYIVLKKTLPRPIKVSLRLPPGVVEEGKIKNDKVFVEYLSKIKKAVALEGSKDVLKVVVCLPSPVVYTQHFSTPNVGDSQLKETADLNLRINSPIDVDKVYMDWELISATEDKYGLMGAFAEKDIIDAYKSVLLSAGFYPVVFEFPSIALSWTINKALGPREKIMLAVNISPDGIEIFLLKRGFIYFSYFVPWSLVKNEEGLITTDSFRERLIEEMNRVISFSENQINETPAEIVFIAPGIEGLVQKTIEEKLKIKTFPLREDFHGVDSSPGADLSIWYTVIGSAIRGGWDRGQDKFISLGTEEAEKIFYREQTLNFIHLWRNIFTGAAAIFLVLLFGTYLIINFQPQASEEYKTLENITAQQDRFKEFENKAIQFNVLVNTMSSIGGETGDLITFLKVLSMISSEADIIINKLSFSSFNSKITLVAIAPDRNAIIPFRETLRRDERFRDVEDPPFNEIVDVANGVRFRTSFLYSN